VLGLARSSVDGLIRSGEVAQLLIDNGVQIPSNGRGGLDFGFRERSRILFSKPGVLPKCGGGYLYYQLIAELRVMFAAEAELLVVIAQAMP
jgi:hypothetical protein